MGGLKDISRKVRDLFCNMKTFGMYSYVNGHYAQMYFDNEVKMDIKSLKHFMQFSKFERDREPVFDYFVQKHNAD